MDISREIKSIESLKSFLKEFFKDDNISVYLFGSRAKGTNRNNSDIDLGIIGNTNREKKVIVKEIIEKSNLPYKVDLIFLEKNDRLYETVIKEGIKWV